MSYLEIILSIAEALFPLAMFVNGFSLGYLVADDLRDRAEARRENQKAAARQNNLPGHEDSGSKPETKANP
jgi:hypothetical protein